MRITKLFLVGVLFLTVMLFIIRTPSGPAATGGDENPDLVILFTGDLQGYLEECG